MLPERLTMGALIEQSAARWPDRVFIHGEDGAELTFADFRSDARAVAKALVARSGTKGDRIAIWAPNSAAWAIVAAGATQIGLELIPLNTRFKGAEAEDILLRGKVRWLFTVDRFVGLDYRAMLADRSLPDLEQIVLLEELDAWLAAGANVPEGEIDARIDAVTHDDVADILFTSGTTGRPKGAMARHGANLRTFQAWSDAMGVREGDRYLIVNPFFHTFGYKAGWIASLMQGATIYPVAVFDAAGVLARIAEERITVLPGPPTIFQSLLDVPDRAPEATSTLRLAITGAASVPPILITRMRDELGIDDVLTAYGLTESCGCASATHSGDPAELVAASCGTPLPGVEVRVVDADGRDLGVGEAGELLIRGFNVMKGYLDDPKATAETIDSDGWLRTGDIATQDAAGYLRITDRAKDLFICGGFNCYPAEIEARILEHPEVARVAVIGRPDERMGEVGHAVLVGKPGAARDPAAFLAWCREQMANYKVPRTVEWVEELPVNAAGKVQRFMLRG